MVEIASHNDVVRGELNTVYFAPERGFVTGGAQGVYVDYGEGLVVKRLQLDELHATLHRDTVLFNEGGSRHVN
jgi:hypothetical protein